VKPYRLGSDLLPVRLLPIDLDGTELEGFHSGPFEAIEPRAMAYARRMLPRLLPVSAGLDLERALDAFAAAARDSGPLQEAFERSSPMWGGVLAVTALEVWALGVEVRGTSSDWDPETLRAAARLLRSERRPPGLVVDAGELRGMAAALGGLACRVEALADRRPEGRPRSDASRLFERLEGPLEGLSMAARARATAGLLASLGGIESRPEQILKAEAERLRRMATPH